MINLYMYKRLRASILKKNAIFHYRTWNSVCVNTYDLIFSFMLIANNLKFEGYCLNLNIRNRLNKSNFACFVVVGSLIDLTYLTFFLGSNLTTILKSIKKGCGFICQNISFAKKPMIFFNNEFYKRNDSKNILSNFKAAIYSNFVNLSWYELNVLNSNINNAGIRYFDQVLYATLFDLFDFSITYLLSIINVNVSNLKRIAKFRIYCIINSENILNIKKIVLDHNIQLNTNYAFFSTFINKKYIYLSKSFFFDNFETFVNTEKGVKRKIGNTLFKKNMKSNWQIIQKLFYHCKKNNIKFIRKYIFVFKKKVYSVGIIYNYYSILELVIVNDIYTIVFLFFFYVFLFAKLNKILDFFLNLANKIIKKPKNIFIIKVSLKHFLYEVSGNWNNIPLTTSDLNILESKDITIPFGSFVNLKLFNAQAPHILRVVIIAAMVEGQPAWIGEHELAKFSIQTAIQIEEIQLAVGIYKLIFISGALLKPYSARLIVVEPDEFLNYLSWEDSPYQHSFKVNPPKAVWAKALKMREFLNRENENVLLVSLKTGYNKFLKFLKFANVAEFDTDPITKAFIKMLYYTACQVSIFIESKKKKELDWQTKFYKQILKTPGMESPLEFLKHLPADSELQNLSVIYNAFCKNPNRFLNQIEYEILRKELKKMLDSNRGFYNESSLTFLSDPFFKNIHDKKVIQKIYVILKNKKIA